MSDLLATDLIAASKILFGCSGNFSDFEVPSRALIKTAYRKKVKLFHPDLAAQSSMSEERLRSIFLKISAAYDLLINYWNASAQVKSSSSFMAPSCYSNSYYRKNEFRGGGKNIPVPATGYMTQDYYYRGVIPLRKLRFGEFLFYTGRINWQTFMNALVYQCKTRPMIGANCVEAGFIDDNDVENIMANRKILECEKFGEAAIRMGYLTKQEISYALRRQYAYGQPFGKYFTDENIFSKRTLQRLLSQFHNRNFQLTIIAS